MPFRILLQVLHLMLCEGPLTDNDMEKPWWISLLSMYVMWGRQYQRRNRARDAARAARTVSQEVPAVINGN